MEEFKRFEDLHAWQQARELMRFVYTVTAQGSLAQDYDLRRQLRRASLSVMANIAEGFSRRGTKEFLNFLSVARASASEIQSLLYVAVDFHAMDPQLFRDGYGKADACIALISGLSKYLRKRLEEGAK